MDEDALLCHTLFPHHLRGGDGKSEQLETWRCQHELSHHQQDLSCLAYIFSSNLNWASPLKNRATAAQGSYRRIMTKIEYIYSRAESAFRNERKLDQN